MITVVIPVINNTNYTDQLLADILENSRHPKEIILIDNGSTENVYKLVENYPQLNITYIRNKENIGVNGSWNLGMYLAKTQFVAILNNDISLNKFFFEKVLETMNLNRNIGLCVPTVIDNSYETTNHKNEPVIFQDSPGNGCCFVLRKDITNMIGPIPKSLFTFGGDEYLYAHVIKMGYRAVQIMNNYIRHYGSKTISKWKSSEQEILHEFYYETFLLRRMKNEMDLPHFEWENKSQYFEEYELKKGLVWDGSEFGKLMRRWPNTEFVNIIQDLVKMLKIETYVELGVKDAYTFNQISPFVKRAIAVDMNPLEAVIDLKHVEKYRMTTNEFSKIWNDKIDLLFIDASHKKEDVMNDFNNFARHVKYGTGLIFLHDTHPVDERLLSEYYCWNSWEAALEIKNHEHYKFMYEVCTIPGPLAGITIIRPCDRFQQLSWRK